jgi:predicted transport protein
MSLFDIVGKNKLKQISEDLFKLERDIQKLIESNLKEIFNLEFIKSEFTIKNSRIDTLAYDSESKSFIIIEYKKERNFSVINQGYAYLSLLINNRAEFIVEYNEQLNQSLKREEIDWSQTRIIFVAPSFTDYQKQAINFKDMPFELWEIKKYQNQIISIEQIRKSKTSESIKTFGGISEELKEVTKTIRVYTEEEHVNYGSEFIEELYETFKNAILNIGDMEIKPFQSYIAFKSRTNVVDVEIQRNALKFWINMKKNSLDDPKHIMRDVSEIGTFGNGDYELKITNDENLEYIMSLIKQSYNLNRK